MRALHACRDRQAANIFVVASHGLFSKDAATVLDDSSLRRIIISDSVPPFRVENTSIFKKIAFSSCAPLFAQAILRSHGNESLNELAEI